MKIENYKENHINLQIKLDNLIQAKKALIREELKIKYYNEINLNTDILKNNLSDIITRMTMLRDDVDKYFTYKNYNNDKNNDEYDNNDNNDKNNDEYDNNDNNDKNNDEYDNDDNNDDKNNYDNNGDKNNDDDNNDDNDDDNSEKCKFENCNREATYRKLKVGNCHLKDTKYEYCSYHRPKN